MTVPLMTRRTDWVCPNCDQTDVTFGPVPNRMHTCPGLHGLTAPLVESGVACKVEAVERGDYTNGDAVQTDDTGRVFMSVVTTRDEGTDCVVLAPAATAAGNIE